MAKYSIKDLENLSGIKAHTLRAWERRYGIIEPHRTSTNIRYYTDDILKKVLNIAFLNKRGIKISRIVKLSREEIREEVSHLARINKDNGGFIHHLIIGMTDLDELLFGKILSDAILQLGFESTVTKVLYPLLQKTGILWQTGNINTAQVHFISNLIRQKLIVAIDGLNTRPKSSGQTFLLFLHEGEYHELGLLFYNYLVKKAGHKSIYLGQNVPFADLKKIYSTHNPDNLITEFISSKSQKEVEEYLEKLRKTFPTPQLFISGKKTENLNAELHSKAHIFSNAIQLKSMISYL